MKSFVYVLMFSISLLVLPGCSNSPPTTTVNNAVEKNVLAYTSDKFTLASVKVTNTKKQTEDRGGYSVDFAQYQVDVTVAAKANCYVDHPENKVVEFVPSCITDKEITDATAEADAVKADPSSAGLRNIASAMIVGQSKGVDKQHPISAGTEFSIKNVPVNCSYDHSSTTPTWVCGVPRH
jgi:hypothetical protein